MAGPTDVTAVYLGEVRRWAVAAGIEPLGTVRLLARQLARRGHWPVGVLDELDRLACERGPDAAESLAPPVPHAPPLPHAPPAPGAPRWPPAPPAELVRPELLGQVYEAALDAATRRRRGAFFTAPAVARGLVAVVLDPAFQARQPEVGDPAVGGGAFLLAACRRLAGAGADLTRAGAGAHPTDAYAGSDPTDAGAGAGPAELATERVWGADIDPGAVAVTRLSLGWWAWEASGRRHWPLAAGRRVVAADALVDDRAWPARLDGGRPWAVVGNPPFLGQLASSTVRSPEEAAQLRARHGSAVRGYVDDAVLFLLAACRHGRPGDRVLLVQPESALVAADAAPARREILERGRLEGLWLGGGDVFAAGVRVCAPLVDLGPGHGRSGGPVRTWRGPKVEAASTVASPPAELVDAPTWAAVTAGLRGVPRHRHGAGAGAGGGGSGSGARGGVLGDLATATAGFRDEYYGLVPFVVERPQGAAVESGEDDDVDERRWARLVTSGLIAPARCRWGRQPVRFAGRRWQAPVVDLRSLGETAANRSQPRLARLARWVTARLRPKLVLATQSAVLAAAVDPVGELVPSVPVVSIEPHDPARLWLLLAAVCSPVASAWAAERFGGAGLGPGALKLAARQALELPLPADLEAWELAAAAYRAAASEADAARWRAGLVDAGALAVDAYRLPAVDAAPLLAWWEDRLPRR